MTVVTVLPALSGRYYRLWANGSTGGPPVLPAKASVTRFANFFMLIPYSFSENLCTYPLHPFLLLSQVQVQVALGVQVDPMLPNQSVPVQPRLQMLSSDFKLRMENMRMQGCFLRAHPGHELASPRPMPPRSLLTGTKP
jgi:hypothetical protein